MINKFETVSSLDGSGIGSPEAVLVERLFSEVFQSALQSASVVYIGNGITKRIDVGFSPQIVVILRQVPISTASLVGEMAVALVANAGKTFITGGGYVSNAVTGFTERGIIVGTDSRVNGSGLGFILFAIG